MNKIIIIGVIGAVLGGVFLAYQSAGPEAPLAPAPQGKTVTKATPPVTASAATASAILPVQPAESSQPVVSAATDPAAKPTMLEAIHLASISYDPAELPRIQPYLTHPDPEVREAALNGVVVLGHAQGAPLLRAAALKLTSSPKEMATFLEKADWLELPSPSPEMMRQQIAKMKAAMEARKGAATAPGTPPASRFGTRGMFKQPATPPPAASTPGTAAPATK